MERVPGVLAGESVSYEIARKVTARRWGAFFVEFIAGTALMNAKGAGLLPLVGLILFLHAFTNLWGTKRVPMVVCTDKAFYLRDNVTDERMGRLEYRFLADVFLLSKQQDNALVQGVNVVTDRGERISFISKDADTAADVVSCVKAHIKAASAPKVVESKIIERERIIEKAAEAPKGAGKGSAHCNFCGASFVRKMSSCPHCGADLTAEEEKPAAKGGEGGEGSGAGGEGIEARLSKLRELHGKGLISDEAFAAKEKELLEKL